MLWVRKGAWYVWGNMKKISSRRRERCYRSYTHTFQTSFAFLYLVLLLLLAPLVSLRAASVIIVATSLAAAPLQP